MTPSWRYVKPGWYLLAAVVIYATVVTAILVRQRSEFRELRQAQSTPEANVPQARPGSTQRGIWFPIPGAELPENPGHLPNAARPYRDGVSEGFDFYDGDSGVPVPYGAAVVAAAPGRIQRVDEAYREPSPEQWQELMTSVVDGASDAELDRLRGRQVWLETEDGKVLRYAHLSGIRDGLEEGQQVERGIVLGYVGNSGTDEGVAGTRRGARLHFEVWDGDEFFGEGMEPDELRIAAASLFNGP